LAVICDVDENTLGNAGEIYGNGVDLERDFSKLVKRDDIEAIVIATPQFNHCELTLQAFENGKHVFCEKPLAVNMEECDKMINAAKESRKVFIVGQQMRYHLHLQKIASLLFGGEIGRPVMLWLNEFRGPFRVSPEHMWIFDKEKSGGMLVEKSCHHFDLFNWFANSKAVSVYASAGQDYFHDYNGTESSVDDNAWVIVNYENGARASLGLCMFMGRPHPTEGGIGYHHREIGIAGTDGLIKTEGNLPFRSIDVRYSDSHNSNLIQMEARGVAPDKFNQEGDIGIFMDFADCIRNGGKPFASGEVGREALAISLAAEKSAEEKRLVQMDEIYSN
jgi:predicted dehydrogenase